MKDTLNKDYYKCLPGMICAMLDEWEEKFGDREGFKEAWEKYRKHILSSKIDEMKMPQVYFRDVLNGGIDERS